MSLGPTLVRRVLSRWAIDLGYASKIGNRNLDYDTMKHRVVDSDEDCPYPGPYSNLYNRPLKKAGYESNH